MAKLLEVVIMPGIKESLKDFTAQEHVLTEVSVMMISKSKVHLFTIGEISKL